MMELRAIRYFLSVAETQSFSRSAALLRVAQPAISRQIQALEQELSLVLFQRLAKGTLLTPEGEMLYRRMLSVVSEYDGIREEMLALRGKESQRFRLGIPPTCAEDHGVRLLELLAKRMPDLRVEMTEGLSRFLPEWLLEGQVDLIMSLHERHTDKIAFRLVEREPLVLLARADHELLGEGPLPIHALHGVPLLLSTGFHQIVTRFAEEYRVMITCRMQIDSIPAIRRISETSGLATIVPQSIAFRETREGRMRMREISPAPLRSLYIGWMKDAHRPGLAELIEDYIRVRSGGIEGADLSPANTERQTIE